MAKRDVYVDLDLHGNQLLAGVVSSSGAKLWTGFKVSALQGYSASYKVFGYTSGALTQIKTYDTAALGVLLLTQNFSYTSGILTQATLIDGRTGAILTRTFSYTSGSLVNISEAIT